MKATVWKGVYQQNYIQMTETNKIKVSQDQRSKKSRKGEPCGRNPHKDAEHGSMRKMQQSQVDRERLRENRLSEVRMRTSRPATGSDVDCLGNLHTMPTVKEKQS